MTLRMPSKLAFLSTGAVLSYGVAMVTGLLLVNGEAIDTTAALVTCYILFSFGILVGVHCIAFGFPLATELPLSRRLPKYLEYAYIVLIALGLLEIVNFAPRYYLYLTTQGDEPSLLEKISTIAAAQIKENCGKGVQHVIGYRIEIYSEFTEDYCYKLKTLTTGSKQAVLNIDTDEAFMDYVISRTVTRGRDEVYTSERTNDITGPIRQVVRLDTFSRYSDNPTSDAVLRWVALLVLPVGLALRALKTSLELFADLK